MEGEKKEGTMDFAEMKKMMIGKAVVKVFISYINRAVI